MGALKGHPWISFFLTTAAIGTAAQFLVPTTTDSLTADLSNTSDPDAAKRVAVQGLITVVTIGAGVIAYKWAKR